MGINEGYSYGGSIEKIPGTGRDPVSDALTGFAKGISDRATKEREAKATKENIAMQAMIQQGYAPAGEGSKPDFRSLGSGWQQIPQNQSTLLGNEHKRAQIADIAHGQAKDKDITYAVEKELGTEIIKFRASPAYLIASMEDQQEGTDKASQLEADFIASSRKRLTDAYSASPFYNVPGKAAAKDGKIITAANGKRYRIIPGGDPNDPDVELVT